MVELYEVLDRVATTKEIDAYYNKLVNAIKKFLDDEGMTLEELHIFCKEHNILPKIRNDVCGK